MNVSNWSPWRIRSWIWPLSIDVFVEDLDADDVADDVGRAVVVAADPDQAEVVAVGVAADDLQAGEVPLGEPLEVQVVEDVAVDDQLAGLVDGPFQELLEEPGLADVAAQVQVADHQAVVGLIARCRLGELVGWDILGALRALPRPLGSDEVRVSRPLP